MGRRLGWLTVVVVGWLLVELTAGVGLTLLPSTPTRDLSPEQRHELRAALASRGYMMPDAELGWTIRPNATKPLYRANSLGMRGDREYGARSGPRVAAFGDSFTHGDEVANPDTWPARLAQWTGVEVLNFGVPAYGLDQAYLRYRREGRAFQADLVLLGFYSGQIERTVNVFRPFQPAVIGLPLAKPRFVLVGDSLVLRPNPLPTLADYRALLEDPQPALARLGREDYFARSRVGWPSLRLLKIAVQMGRDR